MSMHDEFERAIEGSSRRRGMGPLGWLMVSLGMFVVLGVVGVGFAMNRVAHKVEDMLVGFDYDAGAAAAKVVARLEAHTQLLSASPDQGLEFLRGLDGEDPTQAFMGEILQVGRRGDAGLEGLAGLERLADLDRLGDLGDLEQARAQLEGARAERGRARGARAGDVAFNKDGAGGGSLVIRSDDGEVRLDLRRTEDGGSLVIESDEGRARIGLQRTADGGYLTVDSEEGSVRFDLIGGDHGGQLRVSTGDGESLRLALGDDADALPGWVPRFDGMPERPRPVYSLSAHDGVLGAVAWEQDVSAQAVLDSFRAELEEQGYDLRAEHQRYDTRLDEGSLWAKDEASGRIVFVVAHETDEGTKLLVGYGEEAR